MLEGDEKSRRRPGQREEAELLSAGHEPRVGIDVVALHEADAGVELGEVALAVHEMLDDPPAQAGGPLLFAHESERIGHLVTGREALVGRDEGPILLLLADEPLGRMNDCLTIAA